METVQSQPRSVARFYIFFSFRAQICCMLAGKAGPRTAFSIFQIDENKSKMRDARILFGPTCVRNRTWRRLRVRLCKNTPCIYVYMHSHMYIGSRITAGAFGYRARSAVLISLHARILWSLQFQREHLYPLPPSSFSSDVGGIVVLVGVPRRLTGIKTRDL